MYEFFEALRLDGGAVAVQQCDPALLVRDDRAFDAEVIRAVVVYSNLLIAGPVLRDTDGQPQRRVPAEAIRSVFGWIPGVLAERARRVRVPASRVKWRDPSSQEVGEASHIAITLVSEMRRIAPAMTFGIRGRSLTFAQWTDEALGQLPIYTRYRYSENQVRAVSVPLLTGLSPCVAYAVAMILLDRWKVNFWGRIRECPYVRPLRDADGRLVAQGNHSFLDFRLGSDGRMMKGEQLFCCPAHGNRFKVAKAKRKPRGRKHK